MALYGRVLWRSHSTEICRRVSATVELHVDCAGSSRHPGEIAKGVFPLSTKAILLITGTELCRGETHDLNGPYLGRELTELGIRGERILLLPDTPAVQVAAFRDAIEQADLIIASGGLGPTADDNMVSVVATVFDRGIHQDPEAKRRMREKALRRFKTDDQIPANFYKQAEVVDGCEVLLNPVGLAPGMKLETARGLFFVVPGVPRELRALYHEELLPRLQDRFVPVAPRIYRAKIMGVPESVAEARIQSLEFDPDKLEYGIAAKPGELLVKFIAASPDDFSLIDAVKEKLMEEFRHELIALPEGLLTSDRQAVGTTHSSVVHAALLQSGLTVASAESCTSGLVAAELTEHAGSSSYYLGGVVAYANEAKERFLGVNPETLVKHGAVSPEVCEAMARGALERYPADLAVSTTGIAGPGGGTEEKPVGLVYVGLAVRDGQGREPKVTVERCQLSGDRDLVRRQSTVKVLELLRREIEALHQCE